MSHSTQTDIPNHSSLNADAFHEHAGEQVTIEVLDLISEINNPISVVRSEWRALFDQDTTATIFQHPEYALCELEHLPKSRLPSLLLLARRQGKLVGCGALLPKVSSSKHVGGVGPSWKIPGYRLLGNGFLGRSDPDIESILLETAMREVRQRGARFLLVEDLDQSSTLLRQAEGLTSRGFRVYSPTSMQVRLKIQLPPVADDYWNKFSSKTRGTFRRQERKLGDFRVVCSTSLDQVADFLRDANKISVNTWQSDQFGLRIKNDDNDLAQYSFLASQGAFRSYLLYFGDTPVTFVVGIQFRGVFRYDELGFDRQYHALSPGRVLLIKILEDVYNRDTPQWFDFGMGDADYKRIFANYESTAGNVWILPPGLRSLSLIAYLKGSRLVRRGGREAVKALGWYRRMRQKARLGAAVDVNAKGNVTSPADAAVEGSRSNHSKSKQQSATSEISAAGENVRQHPNAEKTPKNKIKADHPKREHPPEVGPAVGDASERSTLVSTLRQQPQANKFVPEHRDA